MTRQPCASSCLKTRPSRAVFPLSFASQKARRVVGIVAFRHPSCWCQKHPCTKTTAKRATNTISGLPGNSFRCNENRKPIRCNKERTRFSGRVSRLRMRLMFQLRCSGVRRSIELCPATNETDTLKCVVCAPAGKFDCPPSLSTLLISAGRIQKNLTLYILFFYRLRGSRFQNRV